MPSTATELYNEIYHARPTMWNMPYRDVFAFDALAKHTQNPGSLLDIGCGNGHTIRYISARWNDTVCYGIDLSEEAIEIAREDVPHAMFTCGAYEYAELPYCDVVLIMGVLEHFLDLDDALSQLKMSGDLIYVECPNCLEYSDSKEEGFRKTYKGTGQVEWHFRRETWEKHITDAGLEIVEAINGPTVTTEFVWILK